MSTMCGRLLAGFAMAVLAVQTLWAAPGSLRIAIPERPGNFAAVPQIQDLLMRAYARLGIAIEWVPLPLKRSEALLAAGQIDGEVVRLATNPEFDDKVVRVDVPVAELVTAVFAIDPTIVVKGPDDLSCCRVGVNQNFRLSERLASKAKAVEHAATLAELVRMLKVHRVDVILGLYPSGRPPLSALGPNPDPEILVVKSDLATVPGYHYLALKHADLAAPLADALRREIAAHH